MQAKGFLIAKGGRVTASFPVFPNEPARGPSTSSERNPQSREAPKRIHDRYAERLDQDVQERAVLKLARQQSARRVELEIGPEEAERRGSQETQGDRPLERSPRDVKLRRVEARVLRRVKPRKHPPAMVPLSANSPMIEAPKPSWAAAPPWNDPPVMSKVLAKQASPSPPNPPSGDPPPPWNVPQEFCVEPNDVSP